MSTQNQDDKLKTRKAGKFSQAAAIDVKMRNAVANEKYADFFQSEEHCAKVEAVLKLCEDYFPVYDLYENQRPNRGKPFTVIKITNHLIPKISIAEKERRFRQPLRDMGLEVKYTSTNSILIRIQ